MRHVLPQIGEVALCVFPGGADVRNIVVWVIAFGKLMWALLAVRSTEVYVVCSRTTLGFIRDLPGLMPALFGKRVVVHCHGSDFDDLLRSRSISGLARFVYSHCEVIFPCLELKAQNEHKVKVAHHCENFFDTGDSPLEKPVLNPSCLRLVWNSNIMASKGFFDVAMAVDTLVQSGQTIEFQCYGKIIGDHELPKEAVRREMSKYEDRDWFTYLGPVPHSRAVSALQHADVVALPSRYSSEMQPLSIIEAMCAGKRVIVSDRASLRATVGGYPADFVATNDRFAIAEILARVYYEKMRNPKNFTAKNLAAAACSKSRFSIGRFDSKMKDILFSGVK